MKQLFEFWIRSLDKNGKPNKPDVSLYNHYLRANIMLDASAGELLDLVAQMEDFGITPNAASFNLVLKAMYKAKETEAAEKLLERLVLWSSFFHDLRYLMIMCVHVYYIIYLFIILYNKDGFLYPKDVQRIKCFI